MTPLDRAVIFADLSGFTAMTETHGDVDAASVALQFQGIAKSCLLDDAIVVKMIGDAVMIITSKAVTAAKIGLQIARVIQDQKHFPMVRIGMHFGPLIESDGDYFGGTVNLAARVAGYARPGQILCTTSMAESLHGEFESSLRDAGMGYFKNIVEPVPLHEIFCHTDSPPALYIDPVCRMQVTDLNAVSQVVHAGITYHFCSAHCATAFLGTPENYS